MTMHPNPPSKPGPPPGFDARRLGRERIARRRERVSWLRKRIIVTAVSTFVIAWTAIFFQLASGHDPALSKSAQATTVSSTASSDDGGSYSQPDSQPVAPVTTQQS